MAMVLGILAALLGGLAGLGYLAAKKVESTYTSFKSEVSGTQSKMPATQPQPMALIAPCPNLPAEQIADRRARQAKALIPLAPDLVLDDVWTVQGKDLESLVQVQSIDDRVVSVSGSGPGVHWDRNGAMVVEPAASYTTRGTCQADLLSAHVLVTEDDSTGIPSYNQTVRFSISRDAYDALKAGRSTELEYRSNFVRAGNGYLWRQQQKFVVQPSNAVYPFPAIVNGKQADLPVIRADIPFGMPPASLVVLDDRANPLILDLNVPGWNFRTKVTKIIYPVARSIETDLAQTGRAAIYGVYFDFDSALIRTESEPTLREIAEVLQQNPGWKLSIEGHTDNIGSDAHNLELSQRRAESVKAALVERYAIGGDRLSTSGFGASRPKATNDTVEGRALNRRVELVKQ